jgi:outer membrane biosynthesis protein TonB
MASQSEPGVEQSIAGTTNAPGQVGGADMEVDDVVDDEGYAQSTTTSYVTSIASNIRRGIEENGRTYPDYGKHMPSVPMDIEEQERNDI